MPSYGSPSTNNYYVGKGRAYFKETGQTEWRHLGNAAAVELEPTIEKLDHFSSMEGVRKKDKSVVIEQGGTLSITLEEYSNENLRLALFGGTVTEQTGGDKEFAIFDASEITGQFKFEGSNDIGPKQFVLLNNVSVNPAGAIPLISDEWGQIELEFEVLADANGDFGIWQTV